MTTRGQSDGLERPLLDVAGSGGGDGKSSQSLRQSGSTKDYSNSSIVCLYLTLVVQWLIMTMTSSFFPDSDVGITISSTWQGFIFAAFPLGSMVTSPFVGPIMERIQKRTTLIIGLTSMSFLILSFGAVPFVLSSPAAAAPTFLVIAFLYGCGSTLAELGAYTILTQTGSARGNLGLLMSLGEVMVGTGAMLGPPVGGALYAWGTTVTAATTTTTTTDLDHNLRFIFPFFWAAGFPLLTLASVLVFVPHPPKPSCADGDEETDTTQSSELDSAAASNSTTARSPCRMTFQQALFAVGLIVSALSYASCRPTLEIRLEYLGVPESSLSSTTGLVFLVGGGTYFVLALPMGTLLDKGCCVTRTTRSNDKIERSDSIEHRESGSRTSKHEEAYRKQCCCAIQPHSTVLPMVIIGVGALLNALSTFLVGPFKLGAVALDVLDAEPWVWVALAMNGASACFMVVPFMPAMLIGVASDDEESQAWVAGIYGTYYALGTTAGPLIAGALMQLELPFLCRPGDWPVDVNASQTTLLPHPTPSLSTSQPSNAGDGKQHCFDGTFTLLCLVLSAYCVVYFVHMCVTLSNMKRT